MAVGFQCVAAVAGAYRTTPAPSTAAPASVFPLWLVRPTGSRAVWETPLPVGVQRRGSVVARDRSKETLIGKTRARLCVLACVALSRCVKWAALPRRQKVATVGFGLGTRKLSFELSGIPGATVVLVRFWARRWKSGSIQRYIKACCASCPTRLRADTSTIAAVFQEPKLWIASPATGDSLGIGREQGSPGVCGSPSPSLLLCSNTSRGPELRNSKCTARRPHLGTVEPASHRSHTPGASGKSRRGHSCLCDQGRVPLFTTKRAGVQKLPFEDCLSHFGREERDLLQNSGSHLGKTDPKLWIHFPFVSQTPSLSSLPSSLGRNYLASLATRKPLRGFPTLAPSVVL